MPREDVSESDRPAKRQRLSSLTQSYFEDASREVQWTDIERVLTSTDSEVDDAERGWIAGQVFMTFLSKQKSEVQLRSSRNLQLKISITCPEYGLFSFRIGQSIRVSLRGACMSRLKGGTSAIGAMPFNITFKDGAAINFMDGRNNGQDREIVDSWQEKHKRKEAEESENWFLSSPTREGAAERPFTNSQGGSVSAATCSSPPSSSPETPGKNQESNPLASSVTISNGDIDEDNDLSMSRGSQQFGQDTITPENKFPVREVSPEDRTTSEPGSKGKKPKKRDTRHENRPSVSDSDSLGGKPKLKRGERKRLRREQEELAKQRSPSPPKRNPALDLVAGVSSETGSYPPLNAIRTTQTIHVIGVVAFSEEPTVTRTGDFKVTVVLVDPSKYENAAGFKITCFMKAGFEHLLPSVSKGHVLLLRDVKAAEWMSGVNGAVYSHRLNWAAYNPDTGKLYHPNGNGGNSAGSFRPAFNAYYQPKESEVQYFKQLGEWWHAIKEEEERGMIRIAEYSSKPPREHRLIGTCAENVFFDATVEILKLEEADSNQTTLFFTDYTPHPLRSCEGYYGQWGMHASTSRIDPYVLDTMKPGQYWSIKNMRLKIGSTGYLEAELYAAIFDEVVDEESDRYLAELLKRKEVYQREHATGNDKNDANEHLFSDISEPGHYNIVAELLYRVNVRETLSDLYVTDYTENILLSPSRPQGLERQLNGSPVTTLQIGAWDGHELVQNLDVGCVYMFNDVRVMRQHDDSLKAHLKFADKRITKMSIKKTDNPTVLALLQRKKEFSEKQLTSGSSEKEGGAPTKSLTESNPTIQISDAIRSRHTDQPKSTIKEIKSTRKCPNKFRLAARIVDFFPLDVTDFTIRMCTNCKQRIPDNYNACIKCEDMMGEYVSWIFRFFFQLEDEEGERIIVDAYSEAKYFLSNIKPCDLRENPDVLGTVKRRLQECLGNLVEVHEALKNQELVKAEYGPYLDTAIKSWEVEEGDEMRRVYALTGCEAVEVPE